MDKDADTGREIREDLIRGLFMVLFFIAARVVGVIVAVTALFQFIVVLFGRRPNERAAEFGRELGLYAAGIIRFMSYFTEAKPWPFSKWPVSDASSVDEGQA